MKVQAKHIEQFVKSPPENICGALIYGPDYGLTVQRANQLSQAIIEQPDDPFAFSELTYPAIKDEPSKLSDELFAMSFTVSRKLIKVIDCPSTINKDVVSIISTADYDNFLLMCAGDLPPSSSLRKCFEKEKHLAAIPCYNDDQRGITQIISQTLQSRGFSFDRNVPMMLSDHFYGDRLVIISELEKLMLYKGSNHNITTEDVALSIEDSSELSLDQLCQALASNNSAKLQHYYDQALEESVAPVSIIRALSRYFFRLYEVRSRLDAGIAIDDALKALRPPVFFKQLPQFKHQLHMWHSSQLTRTLYLLHEIEVECKRPNAPAELALGRLLTLLPHMVKVKAR